MKLLSEARLPIHQKTSKAHTETWHLRLLCRLKYLNTALETSSESL